MKKKFYIFLMAVLFSIPFTGLAQDYKEISAAEKEDAIFYSLPGNSSFAHWSWGVGLGGSLFDGDIFEANGEKLAPTSEIRFTGGANIERTFNPIFGLGLQYLFIPYAASPKEVIYKLKGTAHEVDIYLSVNLLNLFYNERRRQRWGLFLNAGMGMAFYKVNMTNKNTGEVVIDNSGNPMDLKNGRAYIWPFSLAVEYNISKHFAVGLKAEYRMHNKDNFEGYTANVRKGNSNDAFSIGTLTFRHKLHMSKEAHTRNLTYGKSYELDRQTEKLEALIQKVEKLDTTYGNEVKPKIEELEQEMSKIPVIEEQVMGISKNDDNVVDLNLSKIEFDVSDDVIKPEYYPLVDKVVLVMRKNPSYELDIIGHTDISGGKTYNTSLSERRAKSVKNYLIKKGIAPKRITVLGRSYYHSAATNQTVEGRKMNRRVEFVVKNDGKVIYTTDKF
jgi:outer membrane protein OmpA-like peptidoglycan-associated protein